MHTQACIHNINVHTVLFVENWGDVIYFQDGVNNKRRKKQGPGIFCFLSVYMQKAYTGAGKTLGLVE